MALDAPHHAGGEHVGDHPGPLRQAVEGPADDLPVGFRARGRGLRHLVLPSGNGPDLSVCAVCRVIVLTGESLTGDRLAEQCYGSLAARSAPLAAPLSTGGPTRTCTRIIASAQAGSPAVTASRSSRCWRMLCRIRAAE